MQCGIHYTPIPLLRLLASCTTLPFRKYRFPITLLALFLGTILTLTLTSRFFPLHIPFAALAEPGNRHARIAEGDPVRMHFRAPMESASVEKEFRIEPETPGSITWEDADTLVFHPASPLTLEETYTLTVGAEALRRDQTVLGNPLILRAFVAGPPIVSQRLPPENAENVPAESRITLVFDRPMVALTVLSGRAEQFADWPVAISPETEGMWKWISTTTAEFTAKHGLTLDTEYKVSVPAGIAQLDGGKTVADFSWKFATSRPRIERSDPPDGFNYASSNVEVVLRFNQDADLASVRQHTRLLRVNAPERLRGDAFAALRESTPSPNIARSVAIKMTYGKKEEDGKSATDRATVVLIPEEPLPWNAWHAVVADAGIGSPGGSLGSREQFVTQFRTAGPMEVRGARLEWGTIMIDFTNPYNARGLKEQIAITPDIPGWKDVAFEENTWENTTLSFTPQDLAPGTEYTVTVRPGVKDVFGQTLTKESAFAFTTPRTPPRVFIHSEGGFGVFERGKPPIYYLNAVNVSRMDVGFAKLGLREFLAEQAGAQNWEHVPALAGMEMHRTWTIEPRKKENEWFSHPFDLEKELGQSLAGGIYVLTLTAPEHKDTYTGRLITEKIFFSISSTILTLKYSGDHALLWAVDMQTGKPVAGATVRFHDLLGKAVVTGETTSEGFFETDLDMSVFAINENMWNPEIWVTVEKEGDMAFVSGNWNQGIAPYDFQEGLSEDFIPKRGDMRLMSYLYTDRPIYRAGDTVFFKGILRLRDSHGALLPPKNTRRARLRINDAEGKTIISESLAISAFGSFHGSLPLDAKASLGTYSMELELEPGEQIANNFAYGNFEVMAYRKPEFRVDVRFDREDLYAGETARAKVEGAYYFGMPMEGAGLSWRAISTDYFFNRYTDGWYSFSLNDAWCWYECERESELLASGEGRLDEHGTFAWELPVSLESEALSQVLSLDIDIADESNQVVSNRASIPVHKADVYVGIRSEDYAVAPGTDASIGLVTVKPDGSPMGNTRVDLTIFKRTWNTIRKKGVDGKFYYENEPRDERVDALSAETEKDGKATVDVRIPGGGEFRILAAARDGAGREAKADTSVYAWSDAYINWPHSNSTRITVLADKPEYAVGDTATLLVQSPFQGENVAALVTVEREGILQRFVLPIESSAQAIELPITEELIPNAYVSVVIVKPRIGETFDEQGLDTGAPAFRMGYAKLKVENKQKGITVTIEPDKRRYLPGERVEVSLVTQDWQGRPVSAEVSLAAVDMSVLALTGFRVPDLLAIFYGDRGLGVRTAQNLLYLIERYKPGSKGGGGGLEERARGTFKDTAYWNPAILTDEQGHATVSFTLPDNLTTWQLLAIAHSKESLVGSVATEILETKRVIVRPVRPRFAVHGDKAALGAIIHNGTEEERTFTVKLAGSGFAGAAEKRVTVAPEEKAEVNFPVTFGNRDKAEFVFSAESETARDEVHESIPILPFGIPHAVATSGFTEGEAQERVFVPAQSEVEDVTVSASLSPTLAVYLPRGLAYLVQFPYGCAEQTISSFLPNIAVATLQGFDAFHVVSAEELKEKVTKGIERLLTFQRSDGGFGYWVESPESNVYLSTYALHAFLLTSDAGYAVDADVLARAKRYLQEALRRHNLDSRIDLSERAYVLYVLGESGTHDIALLRNLSGKKEQLSLYGKAYLAMALQRAGEARSAEAVLRDILTYAKVSSRGVQFEERNGWEYRWHMSTNSRTTALVLQAILRMDPENALLPQIVRGLLDMRAQGHWDTTQSTTASIFALSDFLRETQELKGAFRASLAVNGKEAASAAFDATTILTKKEVALSGDAFTPGQMSTVTLMKDGIGRLYYDLLLGYTWKTREVLPAEEGMSIIRTIEPVSASPERPTVAGTYKVKLTITAPEERHFVAMESPHPAGMEGVNFALKTSQQYLQEELQGKRREETWWDPSWVFTHKEFRDDQVFLFAEHLPAGIYHYEYLVRATTPGTFHWRAARAYEMYFPEVFGNTESAVITVREKPE